MRCPHCGAVDAFTDGSSPPMCSSCYIPKWEAEERRADGWSHADTARYFLHLIERNDPSRNPKRIREEAAFHAAFGVLEAVS